MESTYTIILHHSSKLWYSPVCVHVAWFRIILEGKEFIKMDSVVHHLQPLGICLRVYNFIMRRLASHAFKRVTLGPPVIQGLPSIPGDAVLSEAGTGCNETEARRPSMASSRAKPPRKTVSINDEVEDIEKTMKVRRKSKSFEKLNSLELSNYEPIPQRPSILKVGSDLNKKRAKFVNQNYN